MRGQPGFFDIDDRLKRLSDLGDQLEAFRSAVDFELFRPELSAALSYTDRTEGGRPPFDPVLMFKILVIQATNNLSDERAEFLINDQSRSLAIRTMSRSIAVSASSANGRPQMRLPMRAVVCAKACSTRAIRRAGCGPIPPTDRRPMRRS